ncbi:hypothetical protein [Teichococcus rhizosphaerae]|nr:hypothetical protein [Pseudoroseomonas rhizosphaerae]
MRVSGSPKVHLARPVPKEKVMRSILLWLLGIPIPIIILLLIFGVL